MKSEKGNVLFLRALKVIHLEIYKIIKKSVIKRYIFVCNLILSQEYRKRNRKKIVVKYTFISKKEGNIAY